MTPHNAKAKMFLNPAGQNFRIILLFVWNMLESMSCLFGIFLNHFLFLCIFTICGDILDMLGNIHIANILELGIFEIS